MAEGFRFHAFGFSQAENLSAQCMGYLGATLTQVFGRTRAERTERTCHSKISQQPRWEAGLRSSGDVTHRKRAEDLGIFWKSQLVELRPASGEDGWLSLARRDLCGRFQTCWGGKGRWKSQNRKIVPLSPYVEEPLNSWVIKSFVPE